MLLFSERGRGNVILYCHLHVFLTNVFAEHHSAENIQNIPRSWSPTSCGRQRQKQGTNTKYN